VNNRDKNFTQAKVEKRLLRIRHIPAHSNCHQEFSPQFRSAIGERPRVTCGSLSWQPSGLSRQ
jgi:hypothetical protein